MLPVSLISRRGRPDSPLTLKRLPPLRSEIESRVPLASPVKVRVEPSEGPPLGEISRVMSCAGDVDVAALKTIFGEATAEPLLGVMTMSLSDRAMGGGECCVL